MLSNQSTEHSVSSITSKLQTMSGNTATTATATIISANQSVVVQRLCEMFGKNYDEVSAAIQAEMTAMEHELQCWKLQMSDRAATTATTTAEPKTKKAPSKPRVKKSDAAAADAAATESNAESSANATVVVIESTPAAETKTKKAPRAKKVAADKPADTVVVIESPAASAEASDVTVTETVAASSASEPKAKKAPRAKKVAAPADSGSESDASVAPVVTAAASASEPKAKKTAAPRAKKADKPDVASDTVASDEQKAKKAPRAKKAAAEKPAAVVAEEAAAEVVVQAAAAVAVTAVVETPIDEESDSQYEEVEIEVVEFTFDGVKYLRSKNEDNTVYDPETSEVVGIWNEANGCIDAE